MTAGLLGGFVRKGRSIATPLLAIVFAVRLGGLPVAAAQGQTPMPQSAAADNSLCPQVKNPDARGICWNAQVQYRQGNEVAGLALVRQALAISPKEGVLHVLVASTQLRRGALAQAEQELRQARKDGVPDIKVLPMLFQVMIARHEEFSLLSEFSEPAIDAKGDVACETLRGRAMALQSVGQFVEAAAAMDRSLSLRRDAEGLLIRAGIATRLNDTALAGKLVDEAFQIAPKDRAAMTAKLKRLEQSNDIAGAMSLSDRLLKLDPASIDARESRIRIFLKQNQNAGAQAEVNAILVRTPKSPLGIYYKAVLMSRAHDIPGAAQTMQGLRLDVVRERPDLALQMAQIVLDNGSTEVATAILGAALGAAPGLLDIRLRLASLRMVQNSPQSALGLLTPVQDVPDPRVQKMLRDVRARIAKDRAF